MQKTLTIKEQNLHDVIKDLMDKALTINRPNKEKICQFIVNLVENGGRKADAAMAAGYGGEKDEDGRERTKNERRSIASSEAYRLLKNDEILSVYEELKAHKLLSKIFVQTLKKDHLIHVLYQAGMRALESDMNFKTGVSALKEAGTLAGFYVSDNKSDMDELHDKLDELLASGSPLAAFAAAHKEKRSTTAIVSESLPDER